MRTSTFTVVIFLSAIAISSCKKSNTPSIDVNMDPHIVGTWELDSAIAIEYFFTPPVILDSTYAHGHTIVDSFSSDGTFSFTNNSIANPITGKGRFTTSSDTLVIQVPNNSDNPATYTISGNTLIIKPYEPDSIYVVTEYYSKVN